MKRKKETHRQTETHTRMIIITIIIIINYYRSIKIFISYINRLFLEQYMFFLYLSVLKQIIKNLSVNVKKKIKKDENKVKKNIYIYTPRLSGSPPLCHNPRDTLSLFLPSFFLFLRSFKFHIYIYLCRLKFHFCFAINIVRKYRTDR